MRNPPLTEYDQAQIKKHEKCWHRWVTCKVWYREVLKTDEVLAREILSMINGKHYTITEELFNQIKTKYENYKRNKVG